MADLPDPFSADFSAQFGSGDDWVSLPPASIRSVKISGLSSQLSYDVRVYATNPAGAGPISPVMVVKTR